MAIEFKSIDIDVEEEQKFIMAFQNFGWRCVGSQRIYNQTTKPTGAIQFQNYTYIHSVTDTVDFVRLSFERDKKMPNYDEIVELEDEFWELAFNINYDKPYTVPGDETPEGWANRVEPDLREKKINSIIHGIFVLLLLVVVALCNTTIIGKISILVLAVHVVLWKLSLYLYKSLALFIATKKTPSIYRTKLEIMYRDTMGAVIYYDQTVNRMKDIINEAENLLDI